MPIIIEDIVELPPIVVDSRRYQLRRFEDHAVLIRKQDHKSALFLTEDCVLWDIQLHLAHRRCRNNANEFSRAFDSICERLEVFGFKDDPWHPLPKGWESHGMFIFKPASHGAIALTH
ncbi:MAG: hypothetical protein V4568_17250 [Pseudomonadota bacterium]